MNLENFYLHVSCAFTESSNFFLPTYGSELYSEVSMAMKRGKSSSQTQPRAGKEPTQASLEQIRQIADSYEKQERDERSSQNL